MRQSNEFCKTLMHSTADTEKHKALQRNLLDSWKESERVGRKHGTIGNDKDELRDPSTLTPAEQAEANKATKASSDAEKALANHEWYMHNKEKKAAYNRQYYQENKDYWKRRLEEIDNKWDKLAENEDLIGKESGAVGRNIDTVRVEYRAAKENYDRATREYNQFMKDNSHWNKTVDSIRSAGQSSISAGRSVLGSLVKSVSSFFSKLFS